MRLGKGILAIAVFMIFVGLSSAFGAEGDATGGGEAMVSAWGNLGAGFAIGVAALGGSLGQGRAAAAALEGIARNPAAQGKIFLPMIISLALIESLVIYAMVIDFVRIHI